MNARQTFVTIKIDKGSNWLHCLARPLVEPTGSQSEETK